MSTPQEKNNITSNYRKIQITKKRKKENMVKLIHDFFKCNLKYDINVQCTVLSRQRRGSRSSQIVLVGMLPYLTLTEVNLEIHIYTSKFLF